MLKDELRAKNNNRRKLLDSNTIQDFSLEISNRVLKLPIWDFAVYHTFLPITENHEVDTSLILTILQGKDKDIVVPKMISNTKIKNYLLTDNTVLKKNKWNIPEPQNGIEVPPVQIDVAFVPLLSFDEKGNRVGYGKGYYDNFLKNCRPDILKIGLSFFEADVAIDNLHENDVPLDYCVTPTTIYTF